MENKRKLIKRIQQVSNARELAIKTNNIVEAGLKTQELNQLITEYVSRKELQANLIRVI